MATDATSDKSVKQGKGHKKLWIALAAVVVFGLFLLDLFETYGNLPRSIVPVLSSGKLLNSTVLQNIIFQKIDSSNTFSANYLGQIIIRRDPPISFSYSKYYEDNRITFSIGGIPPFGNLSVISISRNLSSDGTLCIKSDPDSVFGAISGSEMVDGYRCTATHNSPMWTQLLNIANLFVNVSSMSNIATKSYSITLYDGQPCYSVSGSGIIKVNSTLVDVNSSAQTPVNINFNACFSAQYNIPLTFSANLTAANGSSIQILLNETSINQNTTAHQVDSLP